MNRQSLRGMPPTVSIDLSGKEDVGDNLHLAMANLSTQDTGASDFDS